MSPHGVLHLQPLHGVFKYTVSGRSALSQCLRLVYVNLSYIDDFSQWLLACVDQRDNCLPSEFRVRRSHSGCEILCLI
jgi:hypothetical protein